MPIYEEKEKINGQKRWYIRTYVKDELGNTKQVTRHNMDWIGRNGYWEAQQEENRLKNNYSQTKSELTKKAFDNLTIDSAFDEMMTDDELYNKNSESSRKTYRRRYIKHIKASLGTKKIFHLTSPDITNFIKVLKEKGLDTNYINVIIELVKRIYCYITSKYNLENKVQFQPLRENKDNVVPVTLEDLINQNTTISPEDWEAFSIAIEKKINATKNKKERIKLTQLALLFSCEYILLTRVGETQGMKFKNLIVDANVYVLYEAWNKELKKLTPLKNRKARLLYIPPTLTSMFVELYNQLKKEYNITEDDFLFIAPNQTNIPISRSTIARYREMFCKVANIQYVTNHEFRHAGISNAIHNEVDASAISDMAGHNKQVMFSTYVQTLKKANLQLVNTLDKIKVPNLKQDQKQDQSI